MTPEQKEQMDALCLKIQAERDPKKFNELVSALNTLLSTIEKTHPAKPAHAS